MDHGEHYNELTPAEAERLAILAEEAAEVIQVVMKILRHGYESCHPDSPGITSRQLLQEETTDYAAALEMMAAGGDIARPSEVDVRAAQERKLRYTHHQE